MLAPCIRKSKNRNDAFPVGGLEKGSLFNQVLGGFTNKFRHRFSKPGGIGVSRESVTVGNVAGNHTCFVRFGLSIEWNCPVADTTKFFFRKAIGKNCPHQVRAVSTQKRHPCFRASHRKCDRENAGNRLEKNPVKRADPRKYKQLNQEGAKQQIVSQTRRSGSISQTEPANTGSGQEDKNVLPFFAHDSRRSGIIRNKPRNTGLKTSYRLRGMQDANNDGDGNSNCERCD